MTEKSKIKYAMSRRSLYLIIALSVLAAFVLISLDQRSAQNGMPAQSLAGIDSGDFEKYHSRTFTVVNVVDGDTLDIGISDGKYERTRIRLWGVDTSETKDPNPEVCQLARQACEFTEKLVLGKEVHVYLDAERTRGKYGRLLAYVQLPDERFLNEVLVSQGYAFADLRFRHNFFQKYQQLEAAARAQKKGFWKNVTREQLPQWLQKAKPKLLRKKQSAK